MVRGDAWRSGFRPAGSARSSCRTPAKIASARFTCCLVPHAQLFVRFRDICVLHSIEGIVGVTSTTKTPPLNLRLRTWPTLSSAVSTRCAAVMLAWMFADLTSEQHRRQRCPCRPMTLRPWVAAFSRSASSGPIVRGPRFRQHVTESTRHIVVRNRSRRY